MFGLFRTAPELRRTLGDRARSQLGVETLEERSVPAVFTVTNRSDHNPGSLRAAVNQANANPGADVIRFAPRFDATITLTTGEIAIQGNLTIEGLGANRTAVSGNNLSRVFNLRDSGPLTKVSISGLKLTNGFAGTGEGGAVYVGDSNLTVKNCVISGNRAEEGGALFSYSGSITASNTIFANNGALYGGAIAVVDNGRLTAQKCRFLNNSAEALGGAVAFGGADPSTLINCTISGNTAEDAGGIFAGGSVLTIRNSTIAQNTAGVGGGIIAVAGRLTIQSSTISGNRANGDPTASTPGGGGLLLGENETLIVNSTISGNVDQTVDPGPYSGGGGLHIYGGNTRILNSTIAFNSTVGSGGGILLHDTDETGRLHLASTIVSNSTAPGGNFDVARIPGEGNVSAVNNLIQRIQPGFINGLSQGNILGENPRLLALDNNGGPTQTHAITAGSPAVDAGSNPEQLQTDQRGPGFPRVKGDGIDIGAFEL